MSLGCRIKKPSWRRLASKGARCTALLGVITLYIAMASVLRMRYDRTPFAEPPLRMAHSLQPLMLSPPVPCIGPGGGDLQRVQFETFSEDGKRRMQLARFFLDTVGVDKRCIQNIRRHLLARRKH